MRILVWGVRILLVLLMLAFLVLFLFLRDPRYPVAIALAIPISVVGTFALMEAFDVSLNIMSLGGLALGVGMLVDNSIVVLENIFRHREELGAEPGAAAAAGAEEVQAAITASTLTTISVFGPIIYVEGVAGEGSPGRRHEAEDDARPAVHGDAAVAEVRDGPLVGLVVLLLGLGVDEHHAAQGPPDLLVGEGHGLVEELGRVLGLDGDLGDDPAEGLVVQRVLVRLVQCDVKVGFRPLECAGSDEDRSQVDVGKRKTRFEFNGAGQVCRRFVLGSTDRESPPQVAVRDGAVGIDGDVGLPECDRVVPDAHLAAGQGEQGGERSQS